MVHDISGNMTLTSAAANFIRHSASQAEILKLHPKRIIMNPGAENATLATAAQAQQIEVVEGCTLVMLRTGQF